MKKIYLTTTLPYINSAPHLGFALEIVQADVMARFYRQNKYEVFFNTGTDEHGLKIFRKAKEQGLSPQEYADRMALKYQELKQALNLSYDNFIRTTDAHHILASQKLWNICLKKGDIYKKNYKVKYCVGCEMEKTDSELAKGKCPLHPDQKIEIIEEENYFFKYSKYQKKLLALYKKNPQFVIPESRLNEIIQFTKKGLEDFSVSRVKEKMPWGIEVPKDKKQVIYVWFDALINYISALGWPESKRKFKAFWPGIQFAGKDNLRQQSSMWQAMLMSANLPCSLQIFIHGFITSGSQKMSKSLGNVVDPFELVSKYGTDAVRHFLLAEIPPAEDGDFTIERFEERYNADLASGIGNLVSRVRTMAEKAKIANAKSKIQNPKLKREIKIRQKECHQALEEFKFNEALKAIWGIISWCDRYINEERPWDSQTDKTKEKNEKVLNDLLIALEEIAKLLNPFLPLTSEKILKETDRDRKTGEFRNAKSEALFPRIKVDKEQ